MKKLLTLLLFFTGIAVFGQTTLAEQHFESADVKSVVVNGIFCDVEVMGGSSKVVFDGLIKGDGDSGDYIIAAIQSGSTVVFKVERKTGKNWKWNSLDVSRLNLKIPDNVALKIENTSGDVSVEDYTGEMLEVRATSGDIDMKRVKADCEIRTTSGDFQARGITGDISMVSTSGDQEYLDVQGSVEAGATSGDIEIDKVDGDLRLSATSGDIDLDGVTGSIRANTTSGEIEGDYITLTDDSRFKTTSGGIYITLENDLDQLSFDLRATSGNLKVGGIRADDSLVLEKGDIRIEGISTSGDQVYRH